MEQMQIAEAAVAHEELSTNQLKEAWLNSQAVTFGDPILARARLDLEATYFPLGFPLSLTTNSPAVLEAAQVGWGRFARAFDTVPMRVRITVSAGESRVCPPLPVCRMRDHILTNIADGENAAIIDLSKLFSAIWVTEAAVRHSDFFRYCFLDAAALSCISSAYATTIHAGCVAWEDDAILLCGDAGAGKTTLAYACARAGWTYVTDDGSYLLHSDGYRLVAGNCHEARFRPSVESIFPHLRGRKVMRRAGKGKPSIEFPISSDDHVRTSLTAKVKYMVFLQRNVDKEELAPFPREVSRMYLWQTLQCMPYDMDRHVRAIDSLLDVETFELRYNSLDWAVDRLTRLVREGR